MIDKADDIVRLISEKKLELTNKGKYVDTLEEAIEQCREVINDPETDIVVRSEYYNRKVLYTKAKNKIYNL